MKKIGLTGGIATGKSTVVDILLNEGFNIIDCDKIVKDILKYDDEVYKFISCEFGNEFVDNGVILVREFGDYIFSHNKERDKYEKFIMPKIFHKINDLFDYYESIGESICIVDAPLLIESGLYMDMDYTIVVYANRDIQLERLMLRNALTKENAYNRINAQIDIEEKKRFGDFIIDNSKDLCFLKSQVKKLTFYLRTL